MFLSLSVCCISTRWYKQMGREKVSLLIRGAKVFNTYLKRFREADVAVVNDRFYYIDIMQKTEFEAERTIDAHGQYMIPGLVDIHMHIESSMMTPGAFAQCLAANGVTTIVSEPHEMANVKGMRGIREMIRAGSKAPVDIFYGIPSSVPSTDETLETTGGRIDYEDMKELLAYPEVVCVGEVMNYRGVIQAGSQLEINRFLSYVREKYPFFPVEGHCPKLMDLELAKFLSLGINADHTEHTLEEIRQRMENGMFLEIQQKMLGRELFDYIRDNHLYEHCAFVTDDTMADVLWKKGQLNYVVSEAVTLGFPLEEAVYCATYTPCRRMHLDDRGAIAPGKLADFQLMRRPESFRPERVFKRGREIFPAPQTGEEVETYRFPADFYQSVQVGKVTPEFFRIAVPEHSGEVQVRVIEVEPSGTQTRLKPVTMRVRDGYLDWKDSGCLLAVVLERHGKNETAGFGFLTGSCHTRGTLASTYMHDHHNLMVAGDDVSDMAFAVNRIRKMQGGCLAVYQGEILAELALPVCGLLSDRPVAEIGAGLALVRKAMERLGYRHENPVMSFACLGLPVSPAWKLTNLGLVSVQEGKRKSLIIEKGGNES